MQIKPILFINCFINMVYKAGYQCIIIAYKKGYIYSYTFIIIYFTKRHYPIYKCNIHKSTPYTFTKLLFEA